MIRCHPIKLLHFLTSQRRIVLPVACVLIFLIALAVWLTAPDRVQVPPLQSAAAAAASLNETVLIVGGGSAGMFAAYTLEYLGVQDYVLLEASPKLGGRVQEMDATFADVPLDLGAEWIHVDPRVRQDLLLFDSDDDPVVTDETINYQPQSIRLFWGDRLRWFDFLRFFYREFKFRNSTWYSYLNDYVYPYIAQNVELQAVVQTIDYTDRDSIVVTTNAGKTFRGNKVIVATPVSILQQQDIRFIPELPQAKQKEINAVDMVPGLKAWIEFDKRFYPDVVVIMSDTDKLYMDAVFRKPSNRNILALFEVSGKAEERVRLTKEEILQSMLSELDEMFQGQASAHYVQHYIQNWSNEPYIQGAYSYNRNYDMNAILEPVDGRIYFCGEYLHKEHQATVHGAALSGRSVAEQVLLDAVNS